MENLIIVPAVFESGKRGTTTEPRFVYDYGQVLRISGADIPFEFETHFASEGDAESKTVLGSGNEVRIPDEYLAKPQKILCYIFLHEASEDENGRTVYKIEIPVINRPKPSDQEITPEEHSVISQLIEEVSGAVQRADAAAAGVGDAIEDALQDAKESGEFKGDKGDKGDPGDDYVLTSSDKTEIAGMVKPAGLLRDASGVMIADLPADTTYTPTNPPNKPNLLISDDGFGFRTGSTEAAHISEDYTTIGTRAAADDGQVYVGHRSVAIGKRVKASGMDAIAVGSYSDASGDNAIAMGNWSTASGNSAVAFGGGEAAGDVSYARGVQSVASGRGSSADGYAVEAASDYQTARGTMNAIDSDDVYADIVGNGDSTSQRSNAYALTWDGDARYALDTAAASGTVDGDLVAALAALGWQSDVMADGMLSLKKTLTKILVKLQEV